MTKISSKTVLITGGASGIGKLMGRQILDRGGRLVIWDIDKFNLQHVLSEFKEIGEVYGYTIDIANTTWVQEMAKQVEEEIGPIDILINNAGIVFGGYFNENSPQQIDKTMKINAIAPMQLALIFLPGMLKRKQGHICNITSSAGLVANPKMSVYAGSKWAITGWSDSLRLEMKLLKTGIGVTTVTPYYINTGMFNGVKSKIPILDKYKVSKRIIKAIENNRIYLSMPWSMRLVRLSQGLFPIWFYDWFVGRIIGVYNTMDEFKGRKL